MQIDLNSYNYTSTSVKLTVQNGTGNSNAPAVKDAGKAQESADAYLPSAKYAPDMALVEQMKSSLQTSQQKLFDMVNDLLSKQGMSVTQGQGFWRTLSGGQFQVDAATQAAAKSAISEDGEWGVKKTSERLVNFAKALTGGDPSKVEMMREAFIKGFEAATKAWGRDLPDICKQTYDATMKLFDEWAGKSSGDAETAPATGSGGTTSGSATITFEYERTEISASSMSFAAGDRDAADLKQSGVLSDVSEPLKYDGMTLNSAWCMNEKVTVTITVGGDEQAPQIGAGKDGFVPSARPEEPPMGAYGPNGKRVPHGGPHGHRPHGHGPRNITFDVYSPMKLDKDKTGETVRVGGRDLPLHKDGTVTVGLSDGSLRRARLDQRALDAAARNGTVKVEDGVKKNNGAGHGLKKGHEKNGKAGKVE